MNLISNHKERIELKEFRGLKHSDLFVIFVISAVNIPLLFTEHRDLTTKNAEIPED